jgi:hypothetical protein
MLTLEYDQRSHAIGIVIGSEAAGLPEFARWFVDMDAAQSFVRMAMTVLARRRAKVLELGRLCFTRSEQRELLAELTDLSRMMGGREAQKEATQ